MDEDEDSLDERRLRLLAKDDHIGQLKKLHQTSRNERNLTVMNLNSKAQEGIEAMDAQSVRHKKQVAKLQAEIDRLRTLINKEEQVSEDLSGELSTAQNRRIN